ncbi:MAG: PrsW family glutamic-type intramembrane protease [Armatimonadota bacterium]|nr:PrsW family glutamic-type intramembrane protease [Armatimonadota bacterium]MDR7428322.1 PrsW family glutamic-type intramembrane protease [Armatimonadota bacterium]MDR7463399.1 PrsW family glutamic-type intramembrane protease [Armatimonadota bacterium]MDR7470230.1 PrsW family glutamic-type intramembrane protease [Armatimonadota bacterium]MDR7475582.1 PrsW family glutamic-type intramembrane protease [Armatimonadota bacterium]
MVQLLALMASFVPAILWLWFFYSRDRYEREPKRLIGKLFLWGLLAAPWAAGYNMFLDLNLEPLVDGVGQSGTIRLAVGLLFFLVFLAAFNEEILKYLVTANSTRSDPNFNELADGMIYMTTVALGFAAAENFVYIMMTYVGTLQQAVEQGLALTEAQAGALVGAFGVVAPMRALLTTVGHASFSGITGYFLARRVVAGGAPRVVPLGVLAASLLHAAYNFPTVLAGKLGASQGILSPSFGAVTLVWAAGVVIYLLLLRHALARSPFRSQRLSCGASAAAEARTPAGETPLS